VRRPECSVAASGAQRCQQRIRVRLSEPGPRKPADDWAEAFAIAPPLAKRLEIADDTTASPRDLAREDASVIGARVATEIAKGRVVALRADLQRRSRARQLVPAVPT
jgi:hypothetical protein